VKALVDAFIAGLDARSGFVMQKTDDHHPRAIIERTEESRAPAEGSPGSAPEGRCPCLSCWCWC